MQLTTLILWLQQRILPQHTHTDNGGDDTWPWWLPVLVWPRWRVLGIVAIVYAGLTILWTWPLLRDMADGVIAPPWGVTQPDISLNVWNEWHVLTAWPSGNMLLTQAIFYPQQINLFRQAYGLIQLILTAPITFVMGPIVGVNSILALSYWSGAIGMFVLIYAITKHTPIALLVGWMYAITPAHQTYVAWSAAENASIQWIIVFHISVVWWLRHPSWWRVSVVWLFLLMNTLASRYYGLFGVIYAGLFIGYALWVRGVPTWRRTVVGQGIVCGVVWAVVVACVLIPKWVEFPHAPPVRIAMSHDDAGIANDDWYERQSSPRLSVSLLDLVMPTPEQRWWSWLFPTVRIDGTQMGGYLGVSVLFFLGWSMWHEAKVRHMASLAGALLVCAAGLAIRLTPDAQAPALPGVFWVFDAVSLFRNATRPGLFVLWAWVPILMIIAYAGSQSKRHVIVVAGLLCVWLDFAPPLWVMSPQRASASATVIGNDPDAGSVLTLPFGKNDAQPLLDQVCHGRPITAGYLARIPPFATSMRHITTAPTPAEDVIPVRPIDELANLGVRFVVLKNTAPPYVRRAIQAGGALMLWHDTTEEVWKIPASTRPALVPGAGWGAPEQGVLPNGDVATWRWSSAQSELLLLSQHDAVVRVVLGMSGLTDTTVQGYVNGQRAFVVAVPQQPAVNERVVTFAIRAGLNQVVLATTATHDNGRDIGVAFTRLALVSSNMIVAGESLPAVPQYTQRWLCQ